MNHLDLVGLAGNRSSFSPRQSGASKGTSLPLGNSFITPGHSNNTPWATHHVSLGCIGLFFPHGFPAVSADAKRFVSQRSKMADLFNTGNGCAGAGVLCLPRGNGCGCGCLYKSLGTFWKPRWKPGLAPGSANAAAGRHNPHSSWRTSSLYRRPGLCRPGHEAGSCVPA